MSYEFEDVYLELLMKDEDEFQEFINKIKNTKGTTSLDYELYTDKEGYADYYWENKEDIENNYPNYCYLKMTHSGCYKWYNIREWLRIFNEYCFGNMSFTGDNGESIEVEFNGEKEFKLGYLEYREIPESEWNKTFKELFYNR
ncbi:hypothetical protein [Methanobacterium spitsbergense]|uniref:Uncharacterized protein n=1 Tax=Methanobacterium spitsbergense TaxID=2874285 RepID=A0A8T5V396_9EURY|nr:hypothetical protein [Methanobacterium spitsbergense]MBZ2166341.1 hypothetical protein [Methanobacterium spitsbergense]